MEEETTEVCAGEKDDKERNHCDAEQRLSRKSSLDSKYDSNEEDEETIKPLSPTESPDPQIELSDEGEEADSESEGSPAEKKPEKKAKVEKKRKKRKKKGKMMSDDFSSVSNSGEQKRRSKTQSNKRKKIRKILKEDELQEETRKALKEEEERQKRLEIQAQLAKEAAKNTSQNDGQSCGVADVSFATGDGPGFPDIAEYAFEFVDDIETLSYQDMPDNDFQMLAATPASEFEALLSPQPDNTPQISQRDTIPDSWSAPASVVSVPLTETGVTAAPLHPSESANSLSSEVARFEQMLRTSPATSRPLSTGGLSVEATPQSTLPGMTPSSTITDQPARPKSIGAIGLPPSGQIFPSPTEMPVSASAGQAAPAQTGATSILQNFLTAQSTASNTSGYNTMNGDLPTSLNDDTFMKYQSLKAFKPPKTPPGQKPAQPSSEIICISSESSGDEQTKKKEVSATINSEPINISSGTDSSDDVIFAGTDDNEIVEEDPDINNSGMHVNDTMNQPDADGRVLVNKNRPPDEPEIFLSSRLAAAVKPHQIGGIRFMFDNIVESLEHYKKSLGFGCILAHSMGLGKTLQVIAFIDLFLRHTGAKTALCIVPVNTLLNWVAEFELWIPAKGSVMNDPNTTDRGFKVRLLSDAHKTTDARAAVIASWKEEGGVLLMGYEMFRLLTNQKLRKKRKKKQKKTMQGGEIIETIDLDEEDRVTELTSEIYENLVRPGPDLIVCDEGHRIKNSHATISQALKQIETRRRIVLTGYPLQNNLMEYWCMVDFVRPNFLGTKQEFSNMFERPIQNGQCADSNEADVRLMRFRSHVLHSLLKGFVQRRSHVVLKNSLPPKEEYVLMIRFSQWQKKLYNYFIKYQMKSGGGGWNTSLNPIKAFSICCKIWNHPDVLYRTVVRKTLEEQQSSGNAIDMDLDLPDVVLDGVGTKQRRKRREIRPEKNAETITTTSDGKVIQTQAVGPFAPDERERGLNYEWAKLLLKDYTPSQLEVSGKMMVLMEVIHHSVANNDKLLVFSQSLTTLTLIEEFLFEMDVPNPPGTPIRERKWRRNESYFRLDGNTGTTDRERMVQTFNAKTNDSIHLFLLSTRAGCLGINLVGANRVVVFDISWNPCHDAQAVCRVYRYGQTKKCLIYRLICDQSMEKKIYDRQISKQGMSDRVVDELNPIQSLERQDITKLLIYEDEEKPHVDLSNCEQECSDPTLVQACKKCGHWLTKVPFHHESLLMDCKSQRLTKAEKRAAQQGYEQEKRASSSCNYSRPSYASFYPAAGYPAKKKPGASNGILPNSSSSATADRPVANVRPVQSTPYPLRIGGAQVPGQLGVFNEQTIAYLQGLGVNVRKIIANADIPMPGQVPGPGGTTMVPLVAKGQVFYMINGRKGMYIGTTNGRIFALRSNKDDEGRKTESPLVRSFSGQMVTTREHESQVIKSVFSSIFHPQPAMGGYLPQHPPPPGIPGQVPQRFQNAVGYTGYAGGQSNLMHLMTGQNDTMTQQNQLGVGSMTQQNMAMAQQDHPRSLVPPQMMTQQSQPHTLMTGQNESMTQQNPSMTQQNPPIQSNSMIQSNVVTTQQNNTIHPSNAATLQTNSSAQQNVLTQQMNMPTHPLGLPMMANQQVPKGGHFMGQGGMMPWIPPAVGPGIQHPGFLSQASPWMTQQSSYLSSMNLWPPRVGGNPGVLGPTLPHGGATGPGLVDRFSVDQKKLNTDQQNEVANPQLGSSVTQQSGLMNQQSNPTTQQIGPVTLPSRPLSQESELMTQQNELMNLQSRIASEDTGIMTQPNEIMTQQNEGSMETKNAESFSSLAALISDSAPSFFSSGTQNSSPQLVPSFSVSARNSGAVEPPDAQVQPAAIVTPDAPSTQVADFTLQYLTSSNSQLHGSNQLVGQAPPSDGNAPPTSMQPTNQMQMDDNFSEDWPME